MIFNMKKIFATIAFLCIAFTGTAQSEEFKKDIYQYLEITGGVKSQLVMMEAQLSQILEGENLQNALKEIEAELPELNEKIVALYAKTYTHEEIKEIVKFYQSPVGKKLAEKTVQLQPEMMSLSQEWGMGLQPILMKYLQ